MIRDVFECCEDLETQPLVPKLHDRRESRASCIGCLDQLEGTGKSSLKLGQEGARIGKRMAAVKVEIERLAVTEFLECDRGRTCPVALHDQARTALRDRAYGFSEQSRSLI